MADSFRGALGVSESGGDYGAVNTLGYTGKYQWGPGRLADFNAAMGTDYTLDQFKENPDLQEQAQAWHEQDVMNYVFDNGLDYYLGKNVGGVTMTPEALKAMAHLGGKYGMRQFLESGGEYNPADEYGTSLRDYAIKLGQQQGYETGESMMGKTPLSYGSATEGQAAYSPAQDLLTAYEMMNESSVESCPAGYYYDTITQTCVPVRDMNQDMRSGRPAERGAALQRLGIQSLI